MTYQKKKHLRFLVSKNLESTELWNQVQIIQTKMGIVVSMHKQVQDVGKRVTSKVFLKLNMADTS